MSNTATPGNRARDGAELHARAGEFRPWPRPDNDVQAAVAKYVRIALRYKWSILALTLVGLVIGGLKAANSVPIYRAEATMAIGPDLSGAVAGNSRAMYYATWRFYETQYEMIQSRAVAERVVEKLGLIHRRDLNRPARPNPGLVERARHLLGLVEAASPQSRETRIALDMRSPEQLQRRRESLASMIRGGVSVSNSEDSQIARVRFESPDPEFAAEAANAVVDAYIELGLETRLDRTRRTSAWLTERLDDLRRKVSESENRLQAFQQREGLVDSQSMEQISASRLQFLNDEVSRTRKAVAELSDRYGPKHPKMINAKAELESARQRLDEVATDIVDDTGKQFELSKLEREVAANRQLYESFMEKFEESDMSSQYTISNAQIIDEARVPRSPVRPDRNEFILQWGLSGLVLGVLLALFREQLHNTFRTTEDIEQRLMLPVIGVVPLLNRKIMRAVDGRQRKRAKGRAPLPERHYLGEATSAFSESINHVRTGIMYSNVDNPPRTILVTSSVQGEGKTTLASNLALSFAQLGQTLLVEADLRKPRLESITETDPGGGLVEYVAGVASLDECVVQDAECPSLYVLSGGTVPPNPLELLASQTLARTLAELREKFDHIIIDTAPILPVSDAIVLGHIADSLLLVVQAERTTSKMTRDALRRLENAAIKPMGVVLSQVNVRSSAYHDGQYQYYYGGYYRHPEDA